ncbi:hypothetical protein PHMEG_00019833 [Phytophthora megakarya]|uniref:Chromo domain-containing protein n=1 Tax=Phytophthora megakarya TaxID=4795 RepID=A0A225VQK0_9STRA|nr:hypothetical protein PHMEG_00019833 [Phytophthora megakarya]
MDFVTHMPKSEQRNTFLLLYQDIFSGFVMCKPMSSTTSQDVAEAYAGRVFRIIDPPRSRPEVHERGLHSIQGTSRSLSKIHSTLPTQANGQQERSVQTVIPSVRAYVAEADQSDWDGHAERLMLAQNTSFDASRLDTSFYLVHGWDAQGTVSSVLGPKPSSPSERTAYEWRRKSQCDCSLPKAYESETHEIRNQAEKWRELSERLKFGFERGDAVWLHILKMQPGLSRKLAHLWHGPFRIDDVHDDFRVKLKIDGTGYRVNPWVRVRRLKPRALFPRTPIDKVTLDESDDLDAELLPEDSWEADNEVERILDLRWTKRTRTSRRTCEYLVKWKGFVDRKCIPLSQLNWRALLCDFNQGARARVRFRAMQVGDDHPQI